VTQRSGVLDVPACPTHRSRRRTAAAASTRRSTGSWTPRSLKAASRPFSNPRRASTAAPHPGFPKGLRWPLTRVRLYRGQCLPQKALEHAGVIRVDPASEHSSAEVLDVLDVVLLERPGRRNDVRDGPAIARLPRRTASGRRRARRSPHRSRGTSSPRSRLRTSRSRPCPRALPRWAIPTPQSTKPSTRCSRCWTCTRTTPPRDGGHALSTRLSEDAGRAKARSALA
jgi:hypothetical protein